jgi:hypothetical protein
MKDSSPKKISAPMEELELTFKKVQRHAGTIHSLDHAVEEAAIALAAAFIWGYSASFEPHHSPSFPSSSVSSTRRCGCPPARVGDFTLYAFGNSHHDWLIARYAFR